MRPRPSTSRARSTWISVASIAALALGGGCNKGSSSSDGAAQDAVSVGDSLAAQVAAFTGSWQIAGTLLTTCPGGQSSSDVNDTITISPGTTSDLLVTLDCTFLFDVTSPGVASIRADQPCAVASPPAMLTYTSWTIRTANGVTGSWTSSGSETSVDPLLGTSLTCSFSEQINLTR
jgi:hypothetical protein